MATTDLCVVFDLDDTLYLERDYVRSGFRAVDEWCAATHGLAGVASCAWELFEHGVRGRIFNNVLDELGHGRSGAIVDSMVRVYREHMPSIELAPDAIECLSRLKGTVQLALITDGHSRCQWNKIDALGIRSFFDTVVVTGDWGTEFSKPHPRAFRHVEAISPAKKSFVYVADNPKKDFHAPVALGWRTVRVRRAGGLHATVPCSSSIITRELQDLYALPELVDSHHLVSPS